jgi:DNA (cytosine-5)-methyltransferase 1
MTPSPITFGSWCSGIEAASEAWLPLDWRCAYVAEIEPFPCGYLASRYGAGRPRYMPDPADTEDAKEARRRKAALKALRHARFGDRLVNFGDITQIRAAELPAVDIIAAGFPCQDFSVAGLRASLSGGRGSLSIIGVRLLLEAAELGLVRGAVLEQVPDVLNTADNAWGNILGALVGADAALEGLDHGGRWPRAGMVAGPRARLAWGILDAQHFGLAQRRERVWAVVDFGDGPDPAAVLFERQGLPRHPPAGCEQDEGASHAADGGASRRGGSTGRARDGRPPPKVGIPFGCDYDQAVGRPLVSSPAGNRSDIETETVVVGPAGPQWRPAVEVGPTLQAGGNSTGGDRPPGTTVDTCESLIPVAYSIMPMNSGKDYKARPVDVAQPVMAAGPAGGNQGGDYIVQPIAFSSKDHGADAGALSPTLRAMGHAASHANAGGKVAVAFSLRGREGGAMPEVEDGDLSPALRAAEGGSTRPFIAFDETQITSKANRSNPKPGDPCHPSAAGARPPTLASPMAVRRITVVEAEKLQGFAENATLIHWPTAHRKGVDLAETIEYLIWHGYSPEEAATLAQTPDGPRYRAIGNSWPTHVARWIGERISAPGVWR